MQSSEDKNDKNNNDLKSVRKEKGLSVEDVARKIKLSIDVIKKLENNDFKSLGAYTYIRGYLLHYTELLGVDAQKYIDMVPKDDFNVPLVNTSSGYNKSVKFKRKSKNFASYAMGTFIVVAVCFSGWFLLKNYSSGLKTNNTAQTDRLKITPQNIQGDQNLTDKNDTGTSSITDEDKYHYSSLIPTKPITDSTVNDSSSNDSNNTDIKLPLQPLLSDDSQISPDQNADGLSGDNDQQLDSNNQTVNTSNNSNNKPAYQIIIEAEETSWVKVELMDGTKLHNDLLKPGTVTLESDEKVHFRIGNEQQVKVTINGEVIDISNFARKNIADFNWPHES